MQYLNARHYDPKLAMFIQPDWWEVTQAGVGTNRYGYSFGDPVNGGDPGGHDLASQREANQRYNRENGIGKYAYGDSDFERQRNGLHDRNFDWGQGGNSVKIGNAYLSARQYDSAMANGINYVSGGGGNDAMSLAAVSWTKNFANSGSYLSKQGFFTINNMRQYPIMEFFLNRPGVEKALLGILATSMGTRSESAYLVAWNSKTEKFDMSQDADVRGLGGRLNVRPDTLFTIHTHYDEGIDASGNLLVRVPSPTDVGTASTMGMVVNYAKEIWGYGPIDRLH